MGELALIESGEAQELRIPQQAGDVVYLFKEGTVFRRAGEKLPAAPGRLISL